MTKTVTARIPLSTGELRLMAQRMPRGTPTTRLITKAEAVRSRVVGEALQDHLHHRLAGEVGAPEVPPQDVAEPDQVALVHRAVEAELGLEAGDVLLAWRSD